MEIDGKSPVLHQLQELRREHPDDYGKVMRVAKLLAEYESVTRSLHVKRGAGEYRDVYEMRGGQARLFFFYARAGREIVVCTNLYWKAKPSRNEQNQAFDRSLRLRGIYLAHVAQAREGNDEKD